MTALTEALQAVLKGTPTKDGFSVRDLCALAKMPATFTNRLKMQVFLRGEIDAGRIRTQRGKRLGIDGSQRSVPLYYPTTK